MSRYVQSHPSDPERHQTPANPGAISKMFHVRNGRVGGVAVTWPVKLSANEAFSELAGVTGLPALAAKPSKKPSEPQWISDARQQVAFPPLGAWEPRAVNRPLGQVRTGTIAKWTDYYDQWGKHVGRSPIQFEPLMTTYSKYLGSYKFQATKLAVPLIRVDGAAYAWLELAEDSLNPGYATSRIYVADPEMYWRSRFAEFRNEAKLFDGANTRQLRQDKTLRDLRPYDLDVSDQYQKSVLEHVPVEIGADILDRWRINALLGAVDNPSVPMSTVHEFSSECGQPRLHAALLDGIKKVDVEQCERRAGVIDALDSLEWVPDLADLLRQGEKKTAILKVMRKLAAGHATEQEIEDLQDNSGKWERWFAKKGDLHKKKMAKK